jgi:hypothetical protein
VENCLAPWLSRDFPNLHSYPFLWMYSHKNSFRLSACACVVEINLPRLACIIITLLRTAKAIHKRKISKFWPAYSQTVKEQNILSSNKNSHPAYCATGKDWGYKWGNKKEKDCLALAAFFTSILHLTNNLEKQCLLPPGKSGIPTPVSQNRLNHRSWVK